MVGFLSKIFIKNRDDVKNPAVRKAYGYLCAIIGIFLNLLLFAGKFIAGSIAGSVAVTADAFNNLSDAGSSVINLIGFKLASQKPDPMHPFGHGRYEYIASLFISVIIIIMGFELGKESLDKILHPQDVEYSVLTFVILGVSILVKLYMFLYNRKVAGKIDSASMRATAMDSISDALSTTAVLVCALIGILTGLKLDGYVGLAVTAFILYAGVSSMLETVRELLGTAPDEELVKEIESIVLSHEEVIGIHDFIAHSYGPGNTYVSLHAEVPADRNILEIHDVIDNIENEIRQRVCCLATIHMDPVDMGEETLSRKEMTRQVLEEIDPKILFHDFRIVAGPTHTNLIFDVVVPHKYKYTDEELIKIIGEKISERDAACFCVITVDKDFAGNIK